MNEAVSKIRPKERDTIIQALSAGVVPRVGLPTFKSDGLPRSPPFFAISTAWRTADPRCGL